jgi:hypothetical protein
LTLTWPAKMRKVSVIRHVFLTDVSLSLSRRYRKSVFSSIKRLKQTVYRINTMLD